MNTNIRNIECFLLDIEGTICLDNNLIDGVNEFLDTLVSQNKKYIFMINSLSKLIYVEELKRLGLNCSIEDIITYDEARDIDGICKNLNIEKKSIAIVGDRLYDDMKLGKDLDITSILVLSGESTMYDLEMSDIEPTFVFNSIKNIYTNIKDVLVDNI